VVYQLLIVLIRMSVALRGFDHLNLMTEGTGVKLSSKYVSCFWDVMIRRISFCSIYLESVYMV
jgi:hypothetical protein